MEAYEYIIKELDEQLELLESNDLDVLTKAEEGMQLSRTALKTIRKKIADFEFESESDEICFFKHTKPKIYSRLIYYAKLFNIESKRPRGKSKSQINYFNCHINKLQLFFNDNLNFYHYYRRGATQFDKLYFLREKSDIRLCPDDFHFLTDEDFSTSHDSAVATILAYDLLIIYLKREIDKLENNSQLNELNLRPGNIFWTGKKTDLIELIYALYGSGVINNGAIEIKDIARVVERIFKIDLGNYYHTFVEIKSRKISQAKFLDKLKEALLKYIEKSDE
ncbi:MAG: RteC domain-containing protein [Flavobacteriaceae bacterium]|nr:RteC domain-containing protein [Flavobacteriaceae bacterium]